MNFTEEQIKDAQQRSFGYPYPIYVANLKAIGIDHYDVDVSTHIIQFKGQDGRQLTMSGAGAALQCADHFNIDGIKHALKRVQQSEIDYPGFLKLIAEAGCHTYTADLSGMKVIYKGKLAGNEYIEQIPS